MCATHTAPAEASAPDANRAGPNAPAAPPEWLVHLLARIIFFLLQHFPAVRRRRAGVLPSWWTDLPECAPGSTQALAASIRGPFGNAIARMCRQMGIGPAHPDWPYLSRTILAFGGHLHGLDGRVHRRPWWETPEIVPGMTRAETSPSPALALPSAQGLDTGPASPVPQPAPTIIAPAWPPALWRPVVARAATGPPTGPPACGHPSFCCI